MSKWQIKVDLSDFWHKYPDELTLQEVAQKLIERLNGIRSKVEKKFPDYLDELDEIIDSFKVFAEDDSMNDEVNEFDWCTSNLYDWGDTSLDGKVFGGRKLCWINTIAMGKKG